MARLRLLILDCDSTLSSIEGVDELARIKGPEVYREVEDLTREAMEGRIALEEVFTRRMDLIRPDREELEALGRQYVATVAPGADETIRHMQEAGWTMVVLSGGLYPPVRYLAGTLGIEEVRAVPVHLDADGRYLGFDADYPTARSGGKPELVRTLKSEWHPERIIMVGDGVSDLEVKPEVDRFIGYGEFAVRERVQAEADCFITRFPDLIQAVGL